MVGVDTAEPMVELWVDDHQEYEPGVVTGHLRHARLPLDPHRGITSWLATMRCHLRWPRC